MPQRSPGWIEPLAGAALGSVAGLLCAAAILLPLSQCLIDSGDEDVVLATVLYFKWAAGAGYLTAGVLGAMAGRTLARSGSPAWPAADVAAKLSPADRAGLRRWLEEKESTRPES
jgi:hypothetical protein